MSMQQRNKETKFENGIVGWEAGSCCSGSGAFGGDVVGAVPWPFIRSLDVGRLDAATFRVHPGKFRLGSFVSVLFNYEAKGKRHSRR